MGSETSLWMYFSSATPVVKMVMLLLVAASLASWTIIFHRAWVLKRARVAMEKFEDLFWSGADLTKLFTELNPQKEELEGLAHIFHAGFREFARLRKQTTLGPAIVLEGAERAMRVVSGREMDKLEQNLSFLAIVGLTSPYVGIFGTVCGIMTSLQALRVVQQATISMVAPGISEALVATALGLFAAIPASVAYNRYANTVTRMQNQYESFQEEFSAILHRQAHG